ncbi:MFS transporter [Streptomyces collinus]|uniref:MFS transporter n=1 Tax=Streptomyces collinus TaxID=42684 RepID=UPI0036CC5FFA
MPSANYRSLLRTPGAAAFFLPASLGRVGVAMTGLSVVWLVHSRTGTFASAGLVSGGFAVAEALGAPQLARLVDRFGQTRVLPPTLLAHALAVALLLALVAADAPGPLLALGGASAGACVPQLGAMSAARWVTLLRADRAAELPTAFALESLSNAVAYLAGPMAVSALAAAGHPAVGTVLAASLSVAGGLLLATRHGTAPTPQTGSATGPPAQNGGATGPTPQTGDATGPGPQNGGAIGPPPQDGGATGPTPQTGDATGPGPLTGGATGPPPQNGGATGPARADRSSLGGAVFLLMGLNFALGIYFGALQVSVTAFVVEHGVPGAATPVLAVSNGSGLLAGWLYGARRRRAAPPVQLLTATGALTLGTLLLLVVGSPLGLGAVVVLTGAAVPPLLVLFPLLTEAVVHRSVLTQAFSWLGSASAAGSAAAAAASGWAIDSLGARGGFALTAAAATAMAAQSLAGLRLLPAPKQ